MNWSALAALTFISFFGVMGNEHSPKMADDDPRIVAVRKQMGWDWMQKKRGSIWQGVTKVVKAGIPGQDPLSKLIFGPNKVNPLDSVGFGDDIDYYFLDALRTYVFAPARDPIGEIHNYQTSDAVRKLYGDFLLDFKDDAFWRLSISASIDDRGGDIEKCRGGLVFISAQNHAYISVAKQAFKQGMDVSAMFTLMYPQRHNMDACTWFRATYRDNKSGFIALVNSF
jgi:hypothetical protein